MTWFLMDLVDLVDLTDLGVLSYESAFKPI